MSTVTQSDLRKEKLYHAIHAKQRFIRREVAQDLATDMGILEIQNKMANDRKLKYVLYH
jgi:hypothetical protein